MSETESIRYENFPREQAVIGHGVNAGMPLLLLDKKPCSFYEFWPAWLMYIPVVVYWLLLSLRYRSFGLPMVVNPNIELGGMVGESKCAIFKQASGELCQFILPYISLETGANPEGLAREALIEANRVSLNLPLVIKPDMGCRGRGVALIESEQQLVCYLKQQNNQQRFLLQRLSPFNAEAGVFYIRQPGEDKGKIVSLALKYRPTVVGDGVSNLKKLILVHPRAKKLAKIHLKKNSNRLSIVPEKSQEVALEFAGSHCRGSIFRNGNEFITRALTQRLDRLLKNLPDFHYGRLDIKFRDINTLMTGKDFYIVEINGASSEQAHIWDSRTGFFDAMGVLLGQYRMLFSMGAELRAKGHQIPSAFQLVCIWLKELGYFGRHKVGR